MIFSIKDKPPDINLSIGNVQIGRTNVHKFLGVFIDDKITFSDHISKLCSKLSSGIGMLRRLKSFVPRDVLKQLYYSFIFSHFSYAITSYQSAYQNQSKRLDNLVNRAIKITLNINTLTPAILKERRFMNLEMSIEYFCCINMYKILKTDSHQFFKNKITSFQIEHEHVTRAINLELVHLPIYRLSKCKRSFLYRGLSFWNGLPIDIRNNPNDLRCFKLMLKQYIFDRII